MPEITASEAAAEAVKRLRARDSLEAFIAYLELGYVPAAHHRLLIKHLEAVERGEIRNLMFWLPPGAAKSTYGSVLFPAWWMGRNPEEPILACSNIAELAEYFSRRARNIVASADYRNIFGFGLAEDSKAAGSWENERGGNFIAAGVGGAIAGRRAKLGLIDDPVKGREDADSDTYRQKQWDWYLNDFLTRLKPGAAQIVIQTRWHEDDLSGRILAREAGAWVVVKLPMLSLGEDIDPLKRPVGERLWADYFTDEQVQRARQDVRAWNALYQQDPTPEEGEYFKRSDFQEYHQPPEGLRIYGSSDYAVTEGHGDYTAHGIFGLDADSNIYVLDWWRGKTGPEVWIERQCDLIAKWQPVKWFGEGGTIRKSLEWVIRRRMAQREVLCYLEWLPSIFDKPTRARAFQAKVQKGDVFLPVNAPWKAELLGELLKFPAGKYDDQVDVCSLIGRGLEHARPPAIERKKPPPGTATPPRLRFSGRADGWMVN